MKVLVSIFLVSMLAAPSCSTESTISEGESAEVAEGDLELTASLRNRISKRLRRWRPVARGRIISYFKSKREEIAETLNTPISYPFTTCPEFRADFNNDNTVDSADYDIWRSNYGATNGTGDANGDGRADAADYTVWRDNVGAIRNCSQIGLSVDGSTLDDIVTAGYDNQTEISGIELSSTGSLEATDYRVKVVTLAEAPNETLIANLATVPSDSPSAVDVCKDETGYGELTSIDTPMTVDSSSEDDGYLVLCIRSYANTVSGTAQVYSWLRDTRAPASFNIAEPSVGAGPVAAALAVSSAEVSSSNDIEISWEDAQNDASFPNSPVTYDAVLALDMACSSVYESQEDLETTSATFSAVPNDTYYVCVSAKDGAGNVTEATNSPLLVELGGIADFNITGPVDVQEPTVPFDITWEAAAGANAYEVRLDFDENCEDGVVQTITSNTSYTTSMSRGTLYVCVMALGDSSIKPAANNGFPIVADDEELFRVMFGTSALFNPSQINFFPPPGSMFHGADAASWHCSSFASQVGLIEDWDGNSLLFRAVLGNVGTNTFALNGVAGEIRNVDGSIIFANDADLDAGILQNPIKDENGSLITTSTAAWTGTFSDGSYAANQTCGDWTSTSGVALVGDLSATNSAWVESQTIGCNNGARLICIGDPQ